MKVCVIQSRFSENPGENDAICQALLQSLDACDPSMDLIVLPESCDVSVKVKTYESFLECVEHCRDRVLQKAAETAKRCRAIVCVNVHGEVEPEVRRNVTYVYDREGNMAGRYDKQHLVSSEMGTMRLDCAYTYAWSQPTVLEMEGLRFMFLTCYDFYFYEMYANMARYAPDIIIGCSHQRSDTHEASEIFARFLAYNTNAYVIRASVSMGEDSPVGGTSLVAAPDGKMLMNLGSRVCMETVEIDPHRKYLKPAGYGNPPAPHWQYVEDGRRPWKYRPAGSAICLPDAKMPYPRVCAHRGFSAIAPENTLPAYGAAVAMGAQEIEFDLHSTKDGEIVSIHDPNLERVSDGSGFIREHTLAELKALDFGGKHGASFAGLEIPTLEELLSKLSCHCVMNIHLKQYEDADPDGMECNEDELRKILALIDAYDCRKYVYFMSCHRGVHEALRRLAPDIPRCMGDGDHKRKLVDRAIELGCRKVQLFRPYFDQAMIDKAHAHGIRVNLFWCDDPAEVPGFLQMGVDTILSNDYHVVAQAVRKIQG